MQLRQITVTKLLNFEGRFGFSDHFDVSKLPKKLSALVKAFDKAGISLFDINVDEDDRETVRSVLLDESQISMDDLVKLDELIKDLGYKIDTIGKDPHTNDWLEIVFKKLNS